MSTNAQNEANRANSQHSTGPRTHEGKAKMSLNPTRHGLAGSVLIIDGENPAEFDELYLDLLAEYEPATVTEELLVYKLAEQFWFSRRAAVLMTQASDDKRFALMMRYQGAADRMFLKCLTELRKLQKERKLQEIGSASEPVKQTVPPPAQPTPKLTDLRHPLTNSEVEPEAQPQKRAA